MDWVWTIIVAAIVLCIICITIGVVIIIRCSEDDTIRKKNPDFQEVLVGNGVDVKTGRYIYGDPHFMNKDGIENYRTVVTNSHLNGWKVILSDIRTGKQYKCSFIAQAVIGRDPVVRRAETRMIIPDGSVSKTHCRLLISGDVLVIKDENSKNGTYLNGKQVVGSPVLRDGDRITIGNSTFRVHAEKER